MFFKCFKEKTVTILEDDNEDFEEGTTLSVHKSLTDLKSLGVMGLTTSSPHASNDHDAIVGWSGSKGWCIKFEWNWHD